MISLKKLSLSAVVTAAMVSILPLTAAAEATGNRYNLPRDYAAEVSAAEAFVLTQVKREHDHDKKEHDEDKDGNEHEDVTIIDVRTIEEYVAGHPRKSYNIPYPHIQSRPNRTTPPYIGQNPKAFYDYVAEYFPDRNTPLLTLCRTGFRSVLAANILANPSKWVPEYADANMPGYTNVRNIWEGFVGNHKTHTDATSGEVFTLDLNNDGVIDDTDRDGWSNYQGLPVSTKLRPKLLYQPYIGLYYQ